MSLNQNNYLKLFALFIIGFSFSCLSRSENAGYTQCSKDLKCPVGKLCIESQCYSPQWIEEESKTRRLVSIKNTSNTKISQGDIVTITVGDSLDMPTQFFLNNAQIMSYDQSTSSWREASVQSDLFENMLLLSISANQEIPANENSPLFWIYSEVESASFIGEQKSATLYNSFIDFNSSTNIEDHFVNLGVKDLKIRDQSLLIQDRQHVFYSNPITLPSQISFKARMSAGNCESVYMGINGEKKIGSQPPYTGFFISKDFALNIELAPSKTSTPKTINDVERLESANSIHLYQISIDGGHIQYKIDGKLILNYESSENSIKSQQMYFNVDVDGDGCTFELFDLRIKNQSLTTYEIKTHQDIIFKEF